MTLNSQDFLKETGRLREPAPENGTITGGAGQVGPAGELGWAWPRR